MRNELAYAMGRTGGCGTAEKVVKCGTCGWAVAARTQQAQRHESGPMPGYEGGLACAALFCIQHRAGAKTRLGERPNLASACRELQGAAARTMSFPLKRTNAPLLPIWSQ
jgi:hypothetical protein